MMDTKLREEIEWLNYWIESAREERKKRILILGDSVARGYRPFLNAIAQKENCAVDLLATSYSIFDPLLLNEILHFTDSVGYEYFCIVFNIGAHHGYALQIRNNKDLQNLYFQKLDEILYLLSKQTSNIITVSGTPEKADEPNANNAEIQCRNSILEAASLKYGYQYLDVYSQLHNNVMFPLTDLFHYIDKGYEYIANELGKALGFLTKNISANRINSLNAFLEILKESRKKYIYGDGKRGEKLYKYLRHLNIEVGEKYIVSDGFYKKENQNQILLSEIAGNLGKNDIILVTPEDVVLWKRLEQLGMNYYTLSVEVYEFVNKYVDAFIDL